MKAYPVSAVLLGWMAIIRGVFWLVGETEVVSSFYLSKYVTVGILSIIFGAGVLNLRRWALYGVVFLSIFDIVFFTVFPDSHLHYLFAGSENRMSFFLGVVVRESIPGRMGSIIMLVAAYFARDYFGKSRHFENLMEEGEGGKGNSRARETALAVLTALMLALLIRAHAVQAFKIPTGSMQETLLVGDHLLVNKFIYGTKIPFLEGRKVPIRKPRKGDIIVFRYPKDPERDFIKRIMAVGGDVVESKDKVIFINGEIVNSPYAIYNDERVINGDGNPRDNFDPREVPEGKYFVMGDNRDHSLDSRYWGFVDFKDIKGKALVIYWSWNGKKNLPRFARIGDMVE
jgi:signal peptidase I